MNAILSMLLSSAGNYLQTPEGRQKIIDALPTIFGFVEQVKAKVDEAKAAGLAAEAQKQVAADAIIQATIKAAKQAEADHAANPNTDDAFASGVFRD